VKYKLFKDPVYGYIEIEEGLIRRFIDTPCFQRLRNIIQTSYAPLYPASLHNRFSHSLGVYYLGKIAFKNVKDFLQDEENSKLLGIGKVEWIDAELEELFHAACLLHDIGHAPFSHTGEAFFFDTKDGKTLDRQLIESVGSDSFKRNVEERGIKRTAAHEIMSVIVALRYFDDYFKDKDKEFFARCIVGYQYIDIDTKETEIKNCFIGILNSSIVDVDRLDYIIRDSYVSGYQNVSIDYVRLLRGLTIINAEGALRLGFHKNALSIIENVIFAHDSERKWIQNHPAIQYENFLLTYSIKKVKQYFESRGGYKLFCYEALSGGNRGYPEEFRITFFADEDILYFVKNRCGDDLTSEYLSRGDRRRPLWKSEAEYIHLLTEYLPQKRWKEVIIILRDIDKFLQTSLKNELIPPVINDATLQIIDGELSEAEASKGKPDMDQKDIEEKIKSYKKLEAYFKCFKKFAGDQGVEFSFVIILAHEFKSGFSKKEVNDLLAWFPSSSTTSYIKEISPFLDATSSVYDAKHINEEDFFYFYYLKNGSRCVSQVAFFNILCKELLEISSGQNLQDSHDKSLR
jgi:HD superfamily phosphohydrolase